MKSLLIAAAALSISGHACAQATVALFGTADVNYRYVSGSNSHMSGLDSGNNQASIFGIRGKEDLSPGWAAGFWLEGFVHYDAGTGGGDTLNNATTAPGTNNQGFLFNRRATASLFTPFGEVRMGRDWTPTAENDGYQDPFWGLGVGTSVPQAYSLRGVTFSRASNSIGYVLPSGLGGFFGRAMYAFGEVTGSKDGNLIDGRFGYSNGPASVSVASSKLYYTPGITFGPTGGGSFSENSFGASYDFGTVQLFSNYISQALDNASGPGTSKRTMKSWSLAAQIPVGLSKIKVSYGEGKKTDASVASVDGNHVKQLAFGGEYGLSKRTALYATYSKAWNSGGASYIAGGTFFGNVSTGINQPSSGLDIGIRHNF